MKAALVTLAIVLPSVVEVATAEDTLVETYYCCNDRLDLDQKLALFLRTGNTPSSAPVGSWDVSRVHDSKCIRSSNLLLLFRYLCLTSCLFFHFLTVSGVFAGAPTFNEPLRLMAADIA